MSMFLHAKVKLANLPARFDFQNDVLAHSLTAGFPSENPHSVRVYEDVAIQGFLHLELPHPAGSGYRRSQCFPSSTIFVLFPVAKCLVIAVSLRP